MPSQFDKRKFMQLAIDEMKKSIAEQRHDNKANPKVGAILVSPDGKIIGTAYRGELREGDHAEYTLLDRKFRDKNITGCYLFATLEPCAPGARKHPKLGCAERIVNARIKKVWIGIEDPDPAIDRKGVKYLMDSGIEVEMFDNDFQDIIEKENKEFLKQALIRAHEIKKPRDIVLTPLEKIVESATINEFSQDSLKLYISRAKLKMEPDSPEFLALLEQQQLIEYETSAPASDTADTRDVFRRNDVMPYLVWESGMKNGENLSDTFTNNGERANIVSYHAYDDNTSHIQIRQGIVEKGQKWNITAQSTRGNISDNLFGYHIDVFFQDKDERRYKQEIVRSNGRTIAHNPELIQTFQSQYKPTGLGILLFGKDPRNRFPQAVLKVEVRYGNMEPEIQDFREALVLIPDKVEEWLKKVLSSRISREQFTRTTTYDFPIKVLREVVINALVHRDYDIKEAKCYLIINDNEIIVKSPGLPVSPIKFEDFKSFNAPSLSRNPKLMAIFNAMEYVEERGIGMKEMKSLPGEYNLPLPHITWQDPFLTITFPRSHNFIESLVGSSIFSKLNEEERKGLIYIYNQKEVSKAQYAEQFKFNEKKAQRHLARFKGLKLVKPFGLSKSIKYRFNQK
ncbi:MAG: ATP-binding protein [Bacteroidota bacterium]